jgi:hypothetical protein
VIEKIFDHSVLVKQSVIGVYAKGDRGRAYRADDPPVPRIVEIDLRGHNLYPLSILTSDAAPARTSSCGGVGGAIHSAGAVERVKGFGSAALPPSAAISDRGVG